MRSVIDDKTGSSDKSDSDAYSTGQLQQAVQAYNSYFDDTVPLGLIATAAITFRSSELMTSLLNRIKANASIESWHEFSAEFHERGQGR